MSHRSNHSIPVLGLLLGGLLLLPATGCEARRVAGRAPTAPSLQPVASEVYPVSLGTREEESGNTRSSSLDPVDLEAPRTARTPH